jgi:hypothetical protein
MAHHQTVPRHILGAAVTGGRQCSAAAPHIHCAPPDGAAALALRTAHRPRTRRRHICFDLTHRIGSYVERPRLLRSSYPRSDSSAVVATAVELTRRYLEYQQGSALRPSQPRRRQQPNERDVAVLQPTQPTHFRNPGTGMSPQPYVDPQPPRPRRQLMHIAAASVFRTRHRHSDSAAVATDDLLHRHRIPAAMTCAHGPSVEARERGQLAVPFSATNRIGIGLGEPAPMLVIFQIPRRRGCPFPAAAHRKASSKLISVA